MGGIDSANLRKASTVQGSSEGIGGGGRTSGGHPGLSHELKGGVKIGPVGGGRSKSTASTTQQARTLRRQGGRRRHASGLLLELQLLKLVLLLLLLLEELQGEGPLQRRHPTGAGTKVEGGRR